LSAEIEQALEQGRAQDVTVAAGPIRLLAVDRWNRWGAAFRFGVSANGDWLTDTILAQRTDAGWRELSRGGARGSGWELPWRPPFEGWSGDPLRCLSAVDLFVYDVDDREHHLQAVCGFAALTVAAVRVEWDEEVHDALVTPPTKAFVGLAGGTGHYVLTALDGDTGQVGQPQRRWR
jgi:hypothetical protein